jgi:hypothetical protein
MQSPDVTQGISPKHCTLPGLPGRGPWRNVGSLQILQIPIQRRLERAALGANAPARLRIALFRRHDMKWITREHVKVDRVACPWLIKKFVDKDAEFVFVPPDKVMDEVKRLGAIPYDVKNVELGHHGKECSFEAILKKFKLTDDPALVLLGRIVNGADTDNTLYHQPEGAGLEAIAEGFRHLGFKDDHALNAAEWIVYDALYAYCQRMVREGRPKGKFANS